MIKNPASSASSLFDGGWRSKNRNCLQEEYKLTDDEVDVLCRYLQKLEENKKKAEENKNRLEEIYKKWEGDK